MITVFVNGLELENFAHKELYRDIESLSGSVFLQSNADANLPVKIGDSIRIEVNGVTKLNGFIDMYESDITNNGHYLIVEGRDKVQDLLDSSLKKARDFQAPITLEKIIRSVLDDLGLTDIEVIDNVGDIPEFGAADLISGEDTVNAFEFIEAYAKKRQVLLTGDGNGNIVLNRSTAFSFDEIPGLLQLVNEIQFGTTINNIKQSNLKLNHRERFGIYVSSSQSNLAFLENIVPKDSVNVSSSEIKDEEIRSTRFIKINPENSSDIGTNNNRATWEANIRKTRSFEYTCEVQGHDLNGIVYDINKRINVFDQKQGVDDQLLIKDVNYVESLTDGTITKMTLVKQDSYRLEV